jgi:hypothetical protein
MTPRELIQDSRREFLRKCGMGLGALATPLVGLGGGVGGLPMALVIAASSVAALALFVAVARHTRGERVILDTPEEASADMPVA